MEPKQPIALQSSSNRKDEKTQRTRRHARFIFNPLDKTNQRKYPQLMIAPEEINKIEIVKPSVEAIELFNGMTEEAVEAAPGLNVMLNSQNENTTKNTIFDMLKDNIYLSDNYKTIVENRSFRDSYISSSASFSINDSFLNNTKNDRSTNMLVDDNKDHNINNHGSDVKKKVPSGTRVMLVGDEQSDVQQPGDIAHTSSHHASSDYSELFKAIMKTIIVRNVDDDGNNNNNTDSHNNNDPPQSAPQLKLGPKARKRFLILKFSLPKQHMKLTRHLKEEIIKECKKIDDLDCWSDEENHLFDLPDEDDDVVEEEEDSIEMGADDASSSEGRNKILRFSGAIHNNNNFNLINESRHMGRSQYQDGRNTTTTTTTPSTTSIFVKPSDIVQDDSDELIRNAVNILYRYKRAQLKKAESRSKSSTLQKLRVISTFMLR
jgi:hypothetical protein